jgi:hypothetical protein
MAEQRDRFGAVLLKLGGKGPAEQNVEVFDARDWPDEPEADAGLYRLRVGGKWVTDAGRKFTFFTVWGLALLIARALLNIGFLGNLDAGKPDLSKGQNIRWRPTDETHCEYFGHSVKTRAASDPIHCIDGQWRIVVHGHLVCCDEVQGLDRFGREIQPKKTRKAA